MKRFDVARVLVSTTQMNPISRTLWIKVDGQLFGIMCREEDGSNGHFHLKTDHKTDHNPVIQSDSEDEELEYWSTDHYPEEEFGGNSHDFRRSMWSEDGNNGEDDDVAPSRVHEDEKTHEIIEHSNEGGGASKHFPDYQGSGKSVSPKDRCMEDKSLEDTAGSVIAPESNNVEVTGEGAITERKKVELDNMESLGPVMGQTNSNRNEIIEGNGYMAQEIIVAETQTQKNGVHPSIDSRELSAAKSSFLSESANEALDGGRGESSFWEGFGSDSGPIADWMTRYERTKKKKKKQGKKKSRLCLSVYRESQIVEADGMKTNRKGVKESA
ncbi:hypothetical protein SLA2020_314720, partial [Shorea laevis]